MVSTTRQGTPSPHPHPPVCPLSPPPRAGGQAARAEALFDSLYATCRPDATTFNVLVSVYTRLGKTREAINLVEIMQRGGQAVDLEAQQDMLEAAWCSGVVMLQRYAAQQYKCGRSQGRYSTSITERHSPDGVTTLEAVLHCSPTHVLRLGMLMTLAELRDQYGKALAARLPGSAHVVLRVPTQVCCQVAPQCTGPCTPQWPAAAPAASAHASATPPC